MPITRPKYSAAKIKARGSFRPAMKLCLCPVPLAASSASILFCSQVRSSTASHIASLG